MDGVLGEIDKLRLYRLPDDWVDSVFYFEFTGFEDMPSDYKALMDSIQIKKVFARLLKSFDEAEESDENTWASLAPIVSFRNLLAVLGHYIKYGTDHVTLREHQENALLAARVYFKLLMIPGAQAYNIYHSQLFAYSISCLGFPKLMCENRKKYLSNEHLSSEVKFVLKKMSDYVVDLKASVLQLKLTPADINYEEILSNLIDVTGGAITQSLNVDRILLANIFTVIYEVINSMICNYGELPDESSIDILFKLMVPKLEAASFEHRITNNYVKASYVTYAGVILTKYSSVALGPFTKMLQHLCYSFDTMDRIEFRTARANLVVGLMSLLTGSQHREFLKWLIQLSRSQKQIHRLLALEVLARLLKNEAKINEQSVTIRHDVDRQNAANNALSNETGAGGIPMAIDEDQEPQASDSQMEESEDNAGIHRQEPHTVPLQQIVEAVHERAFDVGSSVRQRALALLAHNVAKTRVFAMRSCTETGSKLSATAERFVSDDRAVVRRSAVALALRLLRTPTSLTALPDLKILVKHCRDGSLSVRCASISAVSELAMTQPNEAVVEAFLFGPFEQLTDPEIKVQGLVKSSLEQVLFKRLVKYTGNSDEILPWSFLQGVIKNNMRKKLHHACSCLATTTKCISVRLVDTLSSHLGVKDEQRDLQCLLFLSSVAHHVDYSDIGFLMEYLYKIAPLPNANSPPVIPDLRHMRTVLELLRTWVRFARASDRARLREHLVRRLAAGFDDGCRIPTAMLAKEVDPSNLIWATELMQISAKTALQRRSLKEALRVADLSMIAPKPPPPSIMMLFLSALKNPPPYCTDVIAGECVVGVGRLALRSRVAALQAAPVLGEVLLRADAPLQVRVNALQTLADCSQRYANIVEPLLKSVCSCFQPNMPPILRRKAVVSVTQLLLSGYLRLRKPLYFDYCALMVDSDKKVREPAQYYVTASLKADIISQYFVDCVTHYSDYTKSDVRDFDSRQLIYDLMLQRMSISQTLHVQCGLAKEIITHAANLVDNAEEVPDWLNIALLDTIKLLTGPRMKLPNNKKETSAVVNIDDIQERVTANIVASKMRTTVAEVMVPAVMRLYARLGAGGGQLAAYLVMLMQNLEVDYKNEIEDLIEDDPELVMRIAAFRENHAVEATAGNMRNLVTSSGPPEPETPRPQRKRASRRETIKSRSLKI